MKAGGQLGSADLAGYRVERRAPLSLDYHGARILTNPPPSSGGTLIGFGLDLLRDSGLGHRTVRLGRAPVPACRGDGGDRRRAHRALHRGVGVA